MANALKILLNGESRTLSDLDKSPSLTAVVAALGLKADRIAIERNGDIIRRATWDSIVIQEGDKLEIVHFVGGGATDRDATEVRGVSLL